MMPQPPAQLPPQNKLLKTLVITCAACTIAPMLLGVVLIGVMGWRIFQVAGPAMAPTLPHQARILINNDIADMKRGDIVMFVHPNDHTYRIVLRVIGLPGESIRADATGHVFINGQLIKEQYAVFLPTEPGKQPAMLQFEEITLSAGQYWMMGDNRNNASGSPEWGPIAKELLFGKVIWCYWPIYQFGSVQ